MNKLEHIIKSGLDKLAEQTPIKGKWKAHAKGDADGLLQLNYNKKNYQFAVELKETLRYDHVAALAKRMKSTEPLLVLAANIPTGIKKALQEKQINYLEANGNAFIQQGDLIVVIDSNNEATIKRSTRNRAFMKTGLKAIFHLLTHPEAANDNHRKLAADTHIALGNIKYIMDGFARGQLSF